MKKNNSDAYRNICGYRCTEGQNDYLPQTGQKAGAKLEEVPKKDEKVDVLELDELCVNLKKTSGSGPQ